MTIDKDQAQMLAALACAVRPTGARQWKPNAVMAEIAKLRGRSLGAVVLAVTRAAMDRNAQRPEVISSAGSHWSDTMLVTDWTPDVRDREDVCSGCGHTEPVCRMRFGGDPDHHFRSVAQAEADRLNSNPDAVTGAVNALRDAVAHPDPRDPAPSGLTTEGKPELAERLAAIVGNNQGLQTPPMQEAE